ncbi:MAG TPA: PAS domain-containing protein [Leptolyngbya sp.]|jgi:PAS domain S-box-containing protein|nr:PAS domain-containing protein [Leptolyngbya sp.]
MTTRLTTRSRSVLSNLIQRIRQRLGLTLGDRDSSSQRIFDVLESVSDAFFSLDQDWRFTYVNSEATRVLNRSKTELLGTTIWESFPEAVGSAFERKYRCAIREQRTISFEAFYPPLEAWFSVRAYPIDSGLAVYFQDVTKAKRQDIERQEAAAALSRSENRYRSLFNSIDEGFCVIEALFDATGKAIDYRFIETNPVFEQQTGFKQALGKTIRELVPDIEPYWYENYGEVALTGEPIRFENAAEPMNRWFDVYAFRIEEPEKRRVAVLFRDITDRKRTEEELRQKNAILSVINEASPLPIFVKDRAGRIIYANPATLKVLDKSESEVIGFRDREIYPASVLGEAVTENDLRIIETGKPEVIEESPDGIRTFLSTKSPYRDGNGKIIGLVGVSNDITERVQFERDRERLLQQEQIAREEAERANRLKDEFLAVLSHELRTPLNPILGWTKLLQSKRLDPTKTAEALQTIERNAKLQSQLIEDLLDISRIMRGKIVLKAAAANLASVISAASETVRLAAEAKQIHLELNEPPTPAFVFGDAGRLQQVFWNLLSNAVKFTPEQGRISIHVSQVAHSVQVQVTDTGKGISPAFLPYLFEYFRQEDGSITRTFGGLGLGLAIARQIVELHGGKISAASAGEHQGATFTVQMPLFRPDPAELPSPPAPSLSSDSSLSGIRVLVVDDDSDTRDFLTFLLEMHGAIVTSVDSALEAIQSIEQSSPDILLSDIGMPEMDGYALMEAIRHSKHRSIPAIALTAYASEFDRTQALAAGFQHHITKPIDSDAVIAIMLELVRQQDS